MGLLHVAPSLLVFMIMGYWDLDMGVAPGQLLGFHWAKVRWIMPVLQFMTGVGWARVRLSCRARIWSVDKLRVLLSCGSGYLDDDKHVAIYARIPSLVTAEAFAVSSAHGVGLAEGSWVAIDHNNTRSDPRVKRMCPQVHIL